MKTFTTFDKFVFFILHIIAFFYTALTGKLEYKISISILNRKYCIEKLTGGLNLE
jgi:hypothetical protein